MSVAGDQCVSDCGANFVDRTGTACVATCPEGTLHHGSQCVDENIIMLSGISVGRIVFEIGAVLLIVALLAVIICKYNSGCRES